jgi:hypothetical protein
MPAYLPHSVTLGLATASDTVAASFRNLGHDRAPLLHTSPVSSTTERNRFVLE